MQISKSLKFFSLSKLGTIFFDQKQVREHLETPGKQARLALREGPLAEAPESG